MRVLFLGFAVSNEMFERVLATDRGLPVQTQRFGWAVASALGEAGVDVRLLSAEPVADFPNNRRPFVRGRSFNRDGTEGRSVSFINLTGFKHITRYLAVLRAASVLRRERFDAVLVHGVHSPFMWAALRIGKRRRVPVVVIVTDPPSLRTPYDNRATLVLKRVDRTLISRALARMDGVVVLAPSLADEFAPGVPSLWMEGIAPPPPAAIDPAPRARPRVVYAGGLREEYGVVDLAKAVAESRGDWEVAFYGRGPAAAIVKEIASTDDRVTFGGAVPTEELGGIYQDASLLVNPRRLEEFTRYSFPSKLLEYMASGTPVLTTMLPNIPDAYRPHLLLSEPGPAALAQAIDDAIGRGEEELRTIGYAASEFIVATRGRKSQGARLAAFLGSVSQARRA